MHELEVLMHHTDTVFVGIIGIRYVDLLTVLFDCAVFGLI